MPESHSALRARISIWEPRVPAGKLAFRQADRTFQYTGEILFHLLRRLSKGDRAGDIRRTVQILRAGIDQKQSFRFQGCVRLRRSGVMNDRSMLGVAADRAEAIHDVLRLFRT